MSTTGPYQRSSKAVPPMKGSFPLDHEGRCKQFMIEYLLCLGENERSNDKCRPQAQTYFECRMKNDLMEREDWNKLGYGPTGGDAPKSDNTTKP